MESPPNISAVSLRPGLAGVYFAASGAFEKSAPEILKSSEDYLKGNPANRRETG